MLSVDAQATSVHVHVRNAICKLMEISSHQGKKAGLEQGAACR